MIDHSDLNFNSGTPATGEPSGRGPRRGPVLLLTHQCRILPETREGQAGRKMRTVRATRPDSLRDRSQVEAIESAFADSPPLAEPALCSSKLSDKETSPPSPTATATATAAKQENPDITAPTPKPPKKYRSAPSSALDIYIEHFGLTERPFSLVPDPEFLFWSPMHKRAYTMLEYGILTRSPITLITGEVGAGKTTLVQHLLKSIGNGVKIGLISNAHGSRGELLRWVLMSLDQSAAREATYVELFASFQTFLIEEYARGNRVILIFDEAQNLSPESLEELRMFTNINANKDELLQLVLVGQPELRDTVRRPDLRQFAQRVTANFHLPPMDAKIVRDYIKHRLIVAGATRCFFSEAATNLIYEATAGVPRLVNQLCDLSMVYASTKGPTRIMRSTVQQVLDDGVFFGSCLPEGKDEKSQ